MVVLWYVVVEFLGGMLFAVGAVVVVVVPCRNGFVVGIVVVFAVMCLDVVPLVCGLCSGAVALGEVVCAVVDACTVNESPSQADEARFERGLIKWYS